MNQANALLQMTTKLSQTRNDTLSVIPIRILVKLLNGNYQQKGYVPLIGYLEGTYQCTKTSKT